MVQVENVYMDLGKKNGVQTGQEFTLFRKGEVFHYEFGQPLAGLRKSSAMRGCSAWRGFLGGPLCSIEGPQPRPEDGVRITRGRIRVAVVPPVT